MSTATFYHAGCPICVNAEEQLLDLIDAQKTTIEIVHLGDDRQRIGEAELAGVVSVPALVHGGQVFHINHGADLSALKG